MEQLRLWRSLSQAEKRDAATNALRQALAARYPEFADNWDVNLSVEDLAPNDVAELTTQVTEKLLGLVWQLEWDFDADVEDMTMPGFGATAYWFKVSDPESGFVLTHNPSNLTGAKLRYYKLIETFEDVVQAIVELADIVAEKLPVVRSKPDCAREVIEND